MKAELISRYRNVFSDGSVVEMVIWRVPGPVPPSTHAFKYRLVFLVDGQRVVGFDNERGKGDHKHVGEEAAYNFVSVGQLVDNFLAEMETWKNAH